jgi:hypothetical protein
VRKEKRVEHSSLFTHNSYMHFKDCVWVPLSIRSGKSEEINMYKFHSLPFV